MSERWQKAKKLVEHAQHIVILQAENPDGDSLGSALALEEIFEEMGKQTTLYCHMPVPNYLRYMRGWDRVTYELPHKFDLTVVVDASVQSLFEKTFASHQASAFDRAPVVIFDHHGNFSQGDHLDQRFRDVLTINDPSYVATSELLYDWAKACELPLTTQAGEHLVAAILADSLGLMSEGTSARTVRIVSELMEKGVNLSELDQRRRELMKKSPEITAYKGRLLQRLEYHLDGQLAIVHIPWEEIAQYSEQYNPSMLVLEEMRMVQGVRMAIALKTYPDGKMTAKIRTNPSGAVADKVAEHFGAGGHPYAAGFKVHTDDPTSIKHEMIGVVREALCEFDGEPC